MDMGVLLTVVLTLLITIGFCASLKRVIRKMIAGECCGAGGCASCSGGCRGAKENGAETAAK